MQGRVALRIALLALAGVILLGLVACQDPAKSATKVVKGWTSSSIDKVSGNLALAATGGVPGLQQIAASAISNQIRQTIAWSYAKPSKTGKDQYQVVATATASADVKVLGFQRTYSLSGDFVLLVDTQQKQVVNWRLDPGSFRFTQR